MSLFWKEVSETLQDPEAREIYFRTLREMWFDEGYAVGMADAQSEEKEEGTK